MALSKVIPKVLKMDGITSVIKYEGDNSVFVWKHPKEDFNTLSQLIVHENQEALFFKDGQALDLFPAGRYTLSTNNIPLLKEIINITTAGKSPFHCEVYFINKSSHMAIRWGTDSQVQYMDPKYNFPLQVGLSGEMILRVNDSRRLIVKVVGTEKNLTQEALVQKFRSILMSKIKPYIANSMQAADYSIFEVDSHMDEFSEVLFDKLIPDFDEYGITLQKFMVTSIAKPEGETAYEKYKEIHIRQYSDIAEAEIRQKTEVINAETEAKKTVIESKALATKRQQEGYTYHQERGFAVAEKIAENEATGEFTNMGIGLGMMAGVGGTVGGMVGGMMNETIGSINSTDTAQSTEKTVDGFKQKLEKLKMMQEMNMLSEEEFAAAKAELMKEMMK